MNPLQRAIVGAEVEERLRAAEEQAHELAEIRTWAEQTYSAYSLLQRQMDDLLYVDLSGGMSALDEPISSDDRLRVLNRLRRLRHANPTAKQMMKLILRFVFGKGIGFEADPNSAPIINAFWHDPLNKTVLTGRNELVHWFDELLTDGEKFIVLASDTGTDADGTPFPPTAPWVRLSEIAVEEVTGTLYDPDNWRIPVWYERTFIRRRWEPPASDDPAVGRGRWVSDPQTVVRYYRDYRISDAQLDDIERRGLIIPERLRAAEVVKHVYINPVRTKIGVRGMSELYASREWLKVFKDFMEDRGAINAMANALAIQRKIKGGAAAVARISGSLGGVKVVGGTDPDAPHVPPISAEDLFAAGRRPGPGSAVDTTDNVDLRNIRADTGATHAMADARMLLGVAGSGTGMSINYLGDISASTLASAQSVELPMTKIFEDYQSFVRTTLHELFEYVVAVAHGRPVVTDEVQVAINMPPLVTQDIVKWVTAFAQTSQQIAPGNAKVRSLAIRGALNALNITPTTQLLEEIDAEERRIAREREEQRRVQMAKQAAPSGNGMAPPDGNEGQRVGGGPSLDVDPSLMRLARGRPPRESPTGPRSRRQ